MIEVRSHYLQTAWRPYPVRPSHHQVAFRVETLAGGRITATDGRAFSIAEIPTGGPDWSQILRAGDWISISSVNNVINEICLLSPCLHEGWGSRVDFARWSRHQEFQIFLGWVREFFILHNFYSVSTPTLVACPGTEPALDPFETEFRDGSRRERLYLPTSPELHLKKLIADIGLPVFEICKVFRNGEITDLHQPEFWMLEWYRPFEGLEAIKRDVVDLIQFLQKKMRLPLTESSRSRNLRSLFRDYLNFDLRPDSTLHDLKPLLSKLQVGSAVENYTFDDIFFLLLMEKIEPHLGPEERLFVEDYPPSQAALARIGANGWAERFELYWKGMEIANAFHELNDPKVQRARSLADLEEKHRTGKSAVALDESFFQALERGLPPTAGIALGLDRLFMALTGSLKIEGHHLYPKMRNF